MNAAIATKTAKYQIKLSSTRRKRAGDSKYFASTVLLSTIVETSTMASNGATATRFVLCNITTFFSFLIRFIWPSRRARQDS
jgi:hypothetical protein